MCISFMLAGEHGVHFSMVYMIANEGRTGVLLSLNSALLQHKLNSALAWAVLDGDFTKLV